MSTAEFRPPKPVQCWQADDYAQKGRFVSDLARPVVDLLAPKRGERILDLGCGGGELTEPFGHSFFEQFAEPERSEVFAEMLDLLRPAHCDADGVWTADHIRLRFAAEPTK